MARKRWRSGVLTEKEDDMPLMDMCRRIMQRREDCLADFARFLADEAVHGKHPNALKRPRTHLAGDLVQSLQDRAVQVFALVYVRWHNTKEAFEDFGPAFKRFEGHRDIRFLRGELFDLYRENGTLHYFTGAEGREQDGRRTVLKKCKWWDSALLSLEKWWSAAQVAAALLDDPMTTAEIWYQDFVKIFPALPLHGFGYWPKFVFGDIGIWVAPQLDLLRDFTFVGVGPFAQLEKWEYFFPQGEGELTRQKAGLNAIRRIQGCINDFLAKGSYGLDPGKISPLTTYDVQVALCQYKKRQ